MGLKFEEDTLETLVCAIKGIDALNFVFFVFTYWAFIYAVVSLNSGNLFNAVIAGLIISILGICSLINVVLEFGSHSIFKSMTGTRNLRRIIITIVLSLLIVLDIKAIIPSGLVLEPLDIVTNYLFFVLLIVPLSEGALDIITVDYKQNMQNFIGIKLDSKSEKRFTYILITLLMTFILSVIYFLIPAIADVLHNNQLLILVCVIIPILLYIITFKLRTSSVDYPSARDEMSILLEHPKDSNLFQIDGQVSRPGTVSLVHLSELILHMGAMGVLMGFLYRAWLIHSKIENGETMEIFTIGIVVLSGVIYSANKIKKMKFSSREIISEYLFGMGALCLGGVVFAIIFNLNTGMGFLTMDVAMTYFYVVQSIAIALALLMSAGRKVRSRLVRRGMGENSQK